MVDESMDSLGSWSLVRSDIFEVGAGEKPLLIFLQWNEVLESMALTCRVNHRVVSDEECCGWSDAFTLNQIHGLVQRFCEVSSKLIEFRPDLPTTQHTLFSTIPAGPITEEQQEELLQFLTIAMELCGKKMFLEVLFPCADEESNYYESWSDQLVKETLEEVERAEDQLKNILFMRSNAVTMFELTQLYEVESESVQKILTALGRHYNPKLIPYLQLREVAHDKIQEAKQGMKNPDLGPRRKVEFSAAFARWNDEYSRSINRVHELYIEYFHRTYRLLKDQYERFRSDEERFGKQAFEVAGKPFMRKLLPKMCRENLNLLLSHRKLCQHEVDKIQHEILTVEVDDRAWRLGSLEREADRWSLKMMEYSIKIYEERRKIYQCLLLDCKDRLADVRGDEAFKDALEEGGREEVSTAVVDSFVFSPGTDDRKAELQGQIGKWQKKIAIVGQKTARLRNKQVALIQEQKEKEHRSVVEQEEYQKHHSLQLRREESRQVELEKAKFWNEERKRTAERLKEYGRRYSVAPPFGRSRMRQSLVGRARRDRPSLYAGGNSVSNEIPLDSGPHSMGPPVPPLPPPPPPPPPLPSASSSCVILSSGDSARSNPAQSRCPMAAASEEEDTDHSSRITRQEILSVRDRLKAVQACPRQREDNPMDSMLQLIKQGVSLKPVKDQSVERTMPPDDHTKVLKDVMLRISSRCRSVSDRSEDEDDEFFC